MNHTIFSEERCQALAARAALGDVTAMLKLAQGYRGALPQEYLALEAEQAKSEAKPAAALAQYRKEAPEGFRNAQASAFWYFRASLYGSREADAFLLEHPGCSRSFRGLEGMLTNASAFSQSFSGKTLRQMGLLNFSEDQSCSISPLSEEGFFLARAYSGYEGPDEDGFGMEEQYNFYCFDEFFNLLGSLLGYSNADFRASRERFLNACREKQARFARERDAYWDSHRTGEDACRYSMLLTQHQQPIVLGNRLVRYFGTQKEYTIPKQITVIGEKAFAGNPALECILVPEHVTEIESGAFSDCPALKKLILPEHLETLPDYLCHNSRALTEVHLPVRLRAISSNMFAFAMSLKEIHLPPTLQTIGRRAFLACPIEELVLPEGITTVGDSAFYSSKLRTISVPGTAVLEQAAFQRCDSLTKVTLGSGITKIPVECFSYCQALEHVSLPETLKTIERSAFDKACSLKKLRIPPSVTQIRYRAIPASTVLCGTSGSYAESYAQSMQQPFAAEDQP